jgi:hypothetical protein
VTTADHNGTCDAKWFGFLALDADLAMTFIDCARLRTNPRQSANSVQNARKALAEIQRSLLKPAARGLSMNEVSYLESLRTGGAGW